MLGQWTRSTHLIIFSPPLSRKSLRKGWDWLLAVEALTHCQNDWSVVPAFVRIWSLSGFELHGHIYTLEVCSSLGVSKHRGGFFQTPPRLCDQASHLKLGDVWPALCIQGSGGGERIFDGIWCLSYVRYTAWNGECVSGRSTEPLEQPVRFSNDWGGFECDELSKWVPLCPLNLSHSSFDTHIHTPITAICGSPLNTQ